MLKIKYLGHSSFKIEGTTNANETAALLIDPFNPKSVGLPYPKQSADIVTTSHNHDDHNFIKNVEGDYKHIDTPGEYEIKGLRIFGIASFHDNQKGKERGFNTIYMFDFNDAVVAHLGDLGSTLNSNQVEALENIDILMIPVGGFYTIDPKTAMQVIETLEPTVVIPMHYKSPKHSNVFDKIATLDEFLKEAGMETQMQKDFTIKSRRDLPQTLTIIPLKS